MKRVNDIGGENWGDIPLTQKTVPDWALLAQSFQRPAG